MPNRELLDPTRYPPCENGADSIRVWNDDTTTRVFYDAKTLSKKRVIDFSRCGVPDEIRSLVWQQLVHKRFGTAFQTEDSEPPSSGGYSLKLLRPSKKPAAFPPLPSTYATALKLYFSGSPPNIEDCALLGGTLLREYTALNDQGYVIAARILAILHYESLLPSFYCTGFPGSSAAASALASASSNLNLSYPGGSKVRSGGADATTSAANNGDGDVGAGTSELESNGNDSKVKANAAREKKSSHFGKSATSVARGVSGSPIQYCPFLASLTVLLLHHSPTDAVLSTIRTLVRRAIDRPAMLRRQSRSRPLRSLQKTAYQYLPLGKHDLRCLNHAFGLLALTVPDCPTHYIMSINPTKLPLWGRWFCDFFVGVLPLPHVFRIIDEYLVEGCVALFRYGLALLALCRSQITDASVWRNLCILFARPNEIYFTPDELASVAGEMKVTAKDLVLKDSVRASLIPQEARLNSDSHKSSKDGNKSSKSSSRRIFYKHNVPLPPPSSSKSQAASSKSGNNKKNAANSEPILFQKSPSPQPTSTRQTNSLRDLNQTSTPPPPSTESDNAVQPTESAMPKAAPPQIGRRHLSQLLGTMATRSTESLSDIIEIRRQAADRDCVRTGEIPEFVPPCDRFVKSNIDPSLPGILSNRHWAAVWASVPPSVRIQRLELLFSTETDGRSFQTLYRLIAEREPLLFMIKTMPENAVIGAFVTAAIPENYITPRFAGTGESFVFTLLPSIKIVTSAVARGQNPNASIDKLHAEYEYRAAMLAKEGKSQINGATSLTTQMAAELLDVTRKPEPEIEGYLFTKRRELMIGAGSFGFSIYIMDDLNRGETQASTTFPNGPLLPEKRFEIDRLDVYTTNSEIPGFRGGR